MPSKLAGSSFEKTEKIGSTLPPTHGVGRTFVRAREKNCMCVRHRPEIRLNAMTTPTTPVSEVLARLDEAFPDPSRIVVATDGDGTLWTGDVGEDFFFSFTKDKRVRHAARAGLFAMAQEYAVSHGGDDAANALYRAYTEGRVPEDRICEMIAWIAAEYTRTELRDVVRDILAREKVAERLQKEAVAIVEWARARGVDTYLVSASPDPVVIEAAELVGIPATHVLAVRPTYTGVSISDLVTVGVERPIPYAAGKAAAIERVAHGRTLAVACGDNVFDAEMLRAARFPVAVRPKKRLLDRLHEVPDLVILEPIP